MKTTVLMIGLAVVAMSTTSAMAKPSVTSREYKVLLNPQNFSYGTEMTNVNQYFTAAKSAIQTAINRDVTGSLSFDKTRQVKFYDTQGSCPLNNLGYMFRERIENGASEVTLKYRGYDHYIADFEDLSSSVAQAETKLEDDISIKPDQDFVVIASKSTSAPNTRTLNDFQDIQVLFPGFAANYSYSASQALNVVGGLTVNEREYDGASIDLGEFDADVSLTLWYNTSSPVSGTKPVVAEASFKYKDSNADYTKKVVNRAALSLAAMKGLSSWVAPSSTLTKTQYVYQYQPAFCN